MIYQRRTEFPHLILIITAVMTGPLAHVRADDSPLPQLPPTPPGVEATLSTNVSQTVSAIPPVPTPALPPPSTKPVRVPVSRVTTDPTISPTPFTSVKVNLSAALTNNLLTLSWPREAAGAMLYRQSGSSTRWDPIPANEYHTNNRDVYVTIPAPILTTYYRVGMFSTPEAPRVPTISPTSPPGSQTPPKPTAKPPPEP